MFDPPTWFAYHKPYPSAQKIHSFYPSFAYCTDLVPRTSWERVSKTVDCRHCGLASTTLQFSFHK